MLHVEQRHGCCVVDMGFTQFMHFSVTTFGKVATGKDVEHDCELPHFAWRHVWLWLRPLDFRRHSWSVPTSQGVQPEQPFYRSVGPHRPGHGCWRDLSNGEACLEIVGQAGHLRTLTTAHHEAL